MPRHTIRWEARGPTQALNFICAWRRCCLWPREIPVKVLQRSHLLVIGVTCSLIQIHDGARAEYELDIESGINARTSKRMAQSKVC
jgi:hypothetical protein